MEKITIKNFLIFDDLEMEIKRLNILIGEQASGKSLLAKLVYFFRKLGEFIPSSLSNSDNFESFKRHQIELFLKIFPPRFWNQEQNFQITFFYADTFSISLVSDFSSSSYIDIHYPKILELEYNQVLKNIQEQQKLKRENGLLTNNDIDLWKTPYQAFEKLGIGDFSKTSLYIPAGRGFFSILEDNSFSLLAGGMAIDPLMQDFGTYFQQLKISNRHNFFSNAHHPDRDDTLNFYEKILNSRYEVIDNQDFLVNSNSKIALSRASSGQQEAFPLVVILGKTLGPHLRTTINYLFIEEPEAHLFPYTQNLIVSAILNSMHLSNDDFHQQLNLSSNIFITTHSPYILSAINNAILADDLVQKGKLTVDEYVEMSEGAYPISLDDVSAYSMDAGKITNIKDESYRMIGGEILDGVSNHFGEVMDKLMALDD